MTVKTKKYNKLAFQFLLLVIYSFVFAIQFTGRFYTIANFYVYHQDGADPISPHPQQEVSIASSSIPAHAFFNARSLSYHLHLSLDKRFQPAAVMEPSFGFSTPPLLHRRRDPKLFPAAPFPSCPDLAGPSLRGPPFMRA